MKCIILLCIKFINILNTEFKMFKNIKKKKKNKRFLVIIYQLTLI